MAVTSGFFNSINGDRKYNARQIGMYLGKIIRSGVFPNPSTNLQVTAAGGMAVQVWPGRGMADCHWMDNDSMYTVILDDADLILDRIDAVVMRLDESDDAREVCIAVKKGAPASSPQAPAMERTEKVEEYCLAQIYVPKIKDDGTQEIIQANITDTRADTEVCGWVTSLIDQVDTHTLFLQWQDAYQRYYDESTAEFETWLAGIKAQLGEDVVSTLMGQIDSLTAQTKALEIRTGDAEQNIEEITTIVDGLGQIVTTLGNSHQELSQKTETMNQNLSQKITTVEQALPNKAGKSTVVNTSLLAADWQGEIVPYTNTLTVEGVQTDSIVEVSLSKNASTDQVKASMNGQFTDGGQSENSITLKAYGRKPDVDIPVVVVVRRDV